MSPEEIQQNKDIEFYTASVNAWYNTRLEHDKSLLTLSAGGVGVLVALLTTVGVRSAEGLVLNVLALVSFLLCITTTLFIFKQNATYVENVIQGTASTSDPWLSKLDTAALIAFLFGVLFTMAIGISSAINSFATKGEIMSNEDKHGFRESFNGSQKLSTEVVEKSFNGAAKLVPTAPQASTPASPNSGGSGSASGTGNSSTSQSTGGGKK